MCKKSKLFVVSLQKQQSQLKQALDESNKKMRDRANEIQQSKVELNIKHQQDNNIVEQLKSIILEKESRIRTLERENRELQADIVSDYDYSFLCDICYVKIIRANHSDVLYSVQTCCIIDN